MQIPTLQQQVIYLNDILLNSFFWPISKWDSVMMDYYGSGSPFIYFIFCYLFLRTVVCFYKQQLWKIGSNLIWVSDAVSLVWVGAWGFVTWWARLSVKNDLFFSDEFWYGCFGRWRWRKKDHMGRQGRGDMERQGCWVFWAFGLFCCQVSPVERENFRLITNWHQIHKV